MKALWYYITCVFICLILYSVADLMVDKATTDKIARLEQMVRLEQAINTVQRTQILILTDEALSNCKTAPRAKRLLIIKGIQ